jgi:hypothetical protein
MFSRKPEDMSIYISIRRRRRELSTFPPEEPEYSAMYRMRR